MAEALEQTMLIPQKEPNRLSRVAVRWLERYIAESQPTLGAVALAVSSLSALGDDDRAEAMRVLRSIAGSF